MIWEIIRERSEKGGIGFSAEVKSKDDKKSMSELIRAVEPGRRGGRGRFVGCPGQWRFD